MTSYRYPDPHDRVPENGIRHDGTADSWPAADRDLVRAAARRLPTRPQVALDVGCGNGRLLETIAAHAVSVIGIDPDAGRIEDVRRLHHDLPDTVQVINTDLLSYAVGRRRAGLVVCSHVIQHVRTVDRPPFLGALRDVIDRDGILLLTWSSSAETQGRHLLSRQDRPGGPVVTTVVDAATFDRSAEATDGTLPVWHAGLGEVEILAEHAGLGIVERGTYRRFTYESSTAGGVAPEVRTASDRYLLAMGRECRRS